MAERKTEAAVNSQLEEMAKKMREAEYKGLSDEEIQKREKQKEMLKKRNIKALEDTLDIVEHGSYLIDGREIRLDLSPEQMSEVQVFLPDDIHKLRDRSSEISPADTGTEDPKQSTGCRFGCENADALAMAKLRYQDLKKSGDASPKILVLNMASSINPGGHVRDGANAQEESLCRRTSLLLSLESEDAKNYYDYNNEHKSYMGNDSLLISPYVEAIKDPENSLIDAFPVSVISCAAPMVRMGLNGMTQTKYEELLYKRIEDIFLAAASQNYRNLILGAFGCGIYGNDAALVSDMFARVIGDFRYEGKNIEMLFDFIDFAILCRPEKDYNYREFARNFSS